MATIEDLTQKSLNEMSIEEGLELIRQIRLSRRTPKISRKKKTSAGTTRASRRKPAAPPALTPELARELLALLEEE